MRLNDPLVNDLQIGSRIFKLDLSFDNVLDILDILNDFDLEEFEKLDLICDLLVEYEVSDDHLVEDFELTFEEQTEIYLYARNNYIDIGEETFIERDILGEPMPNASEKTIDFKLDAKFIYASFFALGINLFDQQGKLTWMEFQALLNALPDDSIMSKIIQIRTWQPKGGESQDYLDEMNKLQKKYSLNQEGVEVDG